MAGRAWPRDLLAGSAIGVGYWLAVMGGLRWALLPGAGTPVWPAAGIAFAGLVLGGSRLWPAVLVARFAASLAVGTPQPAWADLLVAAATTFGAWLPVRLLETGRRLDPRLGSMRDMLWVTVGGGVLGAVISATLGVAALWLGGIALARVPYAWLNWAFGYFVGILTLGPLVLAWSAPGAFQMKPRRWFHLAACLLSVALVSAVVFLRPDDSFLRTWHILPTLVWAALAFQVRGVAAALAIASAAAIFAAVAGTGPLATQPGQEIGRVLLTQQFLAMTGLTMLFLAAVADERRNVEALGRLAAIVSSSPEAMMSLDRRRRFTSWNRGAEILFGWSAADVIGRGPELIVPPFELGARSALSRVLEGETVEEETVRVAKDGTLIDVVVTGAPVYAPDGTIIGAASVIRDVRAAKRAEDALQRLNETLEQRVAERTRDLEQANASLAAEIKAREDAEARIRQMEKMEAIGQLTGGIAHDFNNMLSVVIGSLDIVRRRAKGLEPKHAQLIDNALDGANRAARLTERLLAFSRRQPLSPEPADANRLVAGMSELLRRTLGERHRVEIVPAEALWPVFVDANQLENALVNLAVNARDAMPGGGLLTIETANVTLDKDAAGRIANVEPGDYVTIRVRDTGIGVAPVILDRVFDPFFTTKAPGKGTGLGLSMVYGFARQSGGAVTIASREGEGTCLHLYLPRWRGELAASAPDSARADGPALAPAPRPDERILVVEDEPDVRRLSVQMLTELGYDVVEAADPHAALGLVADPAIRVLFTDVVMPDLDGRRLAEQALKIRPDLKVLFTTGYTPDSALRGGGPEIDVALLPKPFTIDQIAAKMREVIG